MRIRHLRALQWTVAIAVLSIAWCAFAQDKNTVVATVNGASITLQDIEKEIAPPVLALQQQLYALRKSALDTAIDELLLKQEAARHGETTIAARRRLSAGNVEISDADVEKLYAEHEATLRPLGSAAAKERIRSNLETEERLKMFDAAMTRLRTSAGVTVRLEEPRIGDREAAGDGPSLGPAGSPVLITEFGDFECPYCKSSEAAVRRILQEYAGSIRFVYRHFPIEGHAMALPAAQAAVCAREQGKFWEYRNALFDPPDLTSQTLARAAEQVGLDRSAFDRCVDSQSSRLAVMSDARDAKRMGITTTPTFIVNGRVLRGNVGIDQLRAVVVQELRERMAESEPQRKGE